MSFWRKVTSTGVPGCQHCTVVTRTPRELTFSVTVLSLGTGSSGRESSAANIFGIRLSDRRVGTCAAMSPGDLPNGRDTPGALLAPPIGLTTREINTVSAGKSGG